MAIRVAKVRMEMVKEKTVYSSVKELNSPEAAAKFARNLYYEDEGEEVRCSPREVMIVCCVDNRGKPLHIEYVSQGTVNSAVVGMRELFCSAIVSNAAGIFVFHNHPSGSVEPSAADKRMTKRIMDAGSLLDIPVRDHIIIGDNAYFSFMDKEEYRWED